MLSPAIDLRVERVSKQFGETRALSEVSLGVLPGSVHALVGENGAGKSTLGRIVAGAIEPDAGELIVDGAAVAFTRPRDALERGIALIAQEITLVPSLGAPENALLGVEPRRLGFVDRRGVRHRYRALAADAGFDLPEGVPIGGLPIAQQQQVEILRALARDARLIVMDEPTARLSAAEATKLHSTIRSLAASGRSVLLISHFLKEVLDVADTVTVLRDGSLVSTKPTADVTEASLIEAMLGRRLTAQFPDRRPPAADAPVVLETRSLTGIGFSEVSISVAAGEIVGLAGLVGAGRSELGHAIVGAAPAVSGELLVSGRPRRIGSPRQALRERLSLIPESRRDQGLFILRPVRENVSVASLEAFTRLGLVDRRRERAATNDAIARVNVVGAADAPVLTLSGGNQQKVLFARSVLSGPALLVADEPTRGVDVGAKRAIYELLVELAAGGMGVLLISSEMEEILGLAHRAYVMRAGTISIELAGDGITEAAILAAAFATPQPAGRVA
jgi:simple sugar transport system ATP-binding protein/ribose transport system ATP-binding protein